MNQKFFRLSDATTFKMLNQSQCSAAVNIAKLFPLNRLSVILAGPKIIPRFCCFINKTFSFKWLFYTLGLA